MIDIMHIRLEDYYAVIPKTMIFNLYFFFFEGVIGSLNLINVLNICPRKQKYPNNFPNISSPGTNAGSYNPSWEHRKGKSGCSYQKKERLIGKAKLHSSMTSSYSLDSSKPGDTA